MADPKAPMRGHKATFANFLRRKCINNNIGLRLRQFFLLKKNKFHYVLTPPNPHSVKYLLYIRPVHPTQTWWIHKIEKSKNSKFTLCFCFHCLPRVLKKQTKNITKVIDLICLIISSLNVVGKKNRNGFIFPATILSKRAKYKICVSSTCMVIILLYPFPLQQ